MEWLAVLFTVLEKYGIQIAIAFAFGYGVREIRLLISSVNILLVEHKDLYAHVKEKREAEKHPKYPDRLLHRAEILEAILTTQEMLKALCGDCPAILTVKKEMDPALHALQQALDEGKTSREELSLKVGEIHNRLSDFTSHLGQEMINALKQKYAPGRRGGD